AVQHSPEGEGQGAWPWAKVEDSDAGSDPAWARQGRRAHDRAPGLASARAREEDAGRPGAWASCASQGEGWRKRGQGQRWRKRTEMEEEMRRVASGRLRLASGLLLLVLPLAVAVWAFGAFAAKRDRNNADQELVRELDSGASVYKGLLRDARRNAERLASSRRVAEAFAHGDEHSLRTIEQANRWVILVPGATSALQRRDIEARLSVIHRGRTIGRLFVVPPLDRRLIQTIAREAGLPGGRLGLLVDRRLVRAGGIGGVAVHPKAGRPADVQVQALTYRLVALPLGAQRDAPALVAVRKRSEIAAAADDIRWRVIGIGLGLIAAVLVTAYGVAPAIARSRLSRLQRDQAERVIAQLGDGVFVVDHDGVVRLWN